MVEGHLRRKVPRGKRGKPGQKAQDHWLFNGDKMVMQWLHHINSYYIIMVICWLYIGSIIYTMVIGYIYIGYIVFT